MLKNYFIKIYIYIYIIAENYYIYIFYVYFFSLLVLYEFCLHVLFMFIKIVKLSVYENTCCGHMKLKKLCCISFTKKNILVYLLIIFQNIDMIIKMIMWHCIYLSMESYLHLYIYIGCINVIKTIDAKHLEDDSHLPIRSICS